METGKRKLVSGGMEMENDRELRARLREAGLEQIGLAATGEHCRQVFETL